LLFRFRFYIKMEFKAFLILLFLLEVRNVSLQDQQQGEELLGPDSSTQVEDEALPKQSAFDEIYYNNKDVGLDQNLPPMRHLYEGDIMIKTTDQSIPTKRHVIKDELKLWRTREIPYVILPELANISSLIKEAMDVIVSKSCLKFKERTKEEAFIQFARKVGCWSYVGLQDGAQEISIGDGCDKPAIIQHEILHALGFLHENSRADRDTYVEIVWNNTKQEYQRNFDVIDNANVSTSLYEEYDLKSLMHYGNRAFGDGRVTMEARKKEKGFILGNKVGVSTGDVKKLNRLYHCQTIPVGGYGPWKDEQSCSNSIKRRFRICYGKGSCDLQNNNGIQHVNMRCDGDYKGVLKGCYSHGVNFAEQLPLQDYASQDSCRYFNNLSNTPLGFKIAYAYLECRRHAKLNNSMKFGISNYCSCHYGNDDIDIAKNGYAPSNECGDGYGLTQTSIYMYRVFTEPTTVI